MARAFIGVGSNIRPEENVRRALRRLAREVRLLRISTFYRTTPLGSAEQPLFLNGVVEVETAFDPLTLKYNLLRPLEAALGRRRSANKYAPRTIDLDLLLYDDLKMATEILTLPDPDITQRAFLAIPLAELAPELPLPGSDRRLREIAGDFDRESLEPLMEFTGQLQRVLCLRE